MPNESSPGAPPDSQEVSQATLPGPVPAEPVVYRWYHKFSAVLLITLCLEIGLFLLVFPWTDYWENNYFSTLIPAWRQYWTNTYFRGAISGLGVVNLYVSFIEIFRLRRFAKKRP